MNISYIIAAIAIACGVIYIERMQRVELGTQVSVIRPPLPKANIIFNKTSLMSAASITSGTWTTQILTYPQENTTITTSGTTSYVPMVGKVK